MFESYSYQGKIVFNIDKNGDNFETFHKVVDFLKFKKVEIKDFYAGGWDISYLKFYYGKIYAELFFRDFGGTDLSIDENISHVDFNVINSLLEELQKYLND